MYLRIAHLLILLKRHVTRLADSKFTPLMVAAVNDHSDVVELLLERGIAYALIYTSFFCDSKLDRL